MTPKPIDTKNQKSVCFMNPLISPLNNNFNAVRLNDFRALIKRSKIPVISAIVPPETPGITLAVPTAIPLKKFAKY